MHTHRAARFAALILGLFLALGERAVADAVDALIITQRVNRVTPSCLAFPERPVVGRVSGVIEYENPAPVAFVGCFESFAACERWRVPVSWEIIGRIVLNECTHR